MQQQGDDKAADEKALIQSQDLEHQPRTETRVPNRGLKVQPPMVDSPERRDLAEEEKKAKETVEEFERSVRQQVPG